jgi:hypothetical protein
MSSVPSGATVLERGPCVIDGRLPDETVLLRTDTGDSVRLNATAAWLWEQLAGATTVEELGRRLEAEYGIGAERALADAASFAEALGERGFLALGSATA